MLEFIQAYTEYKQEAQEQACENIQENCNCENANDDNACLYQCYVSAGMEVCFENENQNQNGNQQQEFELEEYLECKEMEAQNDNNNGNQYQYFIGPYCDSYDGWSIHLGVFYDESCTSRTDSDVFSNFNYGMELPYSSDPIVESDCISCMQVEENDNNNNQNNNYYYNGNNYYNNQEEELQVNELCGGLYEEAAKCERYVNTAYPDNSACEYIEDILPKLEYATRSGAIAETTSIVHTASSIIGEGGAKAFMWIFATTTFLLGAYVYFLKGKESRRSIDLSSDA